MRVLVISHSGDSTGAAIALIRIMRWAVMHDQVEPVFILRSDGSLAESFRALGPTFVLFRENGAHG